MTLQQSSATVVCNSLLLRQFSLAENLREWLTHHLTTRSYFT